jgi:hypothetical protein
MMDGKTDCGETDEKAIDTPAEIARYAKQPTKTHRSHGDILKPVVVVAIFYVFKQPESCIGRVAYEISESLTFLRALSIGAQKKETRIPLYLITDQTEDYNRACRHHTNAS